MLGSLEAARVFLKNFRLSVSAVGEPPIATIARALLSDKGETQRPGHLVQVFGEYVVTSADNLRTIFLDATGNGSLAFSAPLSPCFVTVAPYGDPTAVSGDITTSDPATDVTNTILEAGTVTRFVGDPVNGVWRCLDPANLTA